MYENDWLYRESWKIDKTISLTISFFTCDLSWFVENSSVMLQYGKYENSFGVRSFSFHCNTAIYSELCELLMFCKCICHSVRLCFIWRKGLYTRVYLMLSERLFYMVNNISAESVGVYQSLGTNAFSLEIILRYYFSLRVLTVWLSLQLIFLQKKKRN